MEEECMLNQFRHVPGSVVANSRIVKQTTGEGGFIFKVSTLWGLNALKQKVGKERVLMCLSAHSLRVRSQLHMVGGLAVKMFQLHLICGVSNLFRVLQHYMAEDCIFIHINQHLQATTFIAISSSSTIAVAQPLPLHMATIYVYQHTEKKEWLKEGMKDRYVGVGGSDSSNLCGMSEASPCKTVGHAVGSSMGQLSSTITVLGGRHVSEGATISVGEKKISVEGKGKAVSVIGTNSLFSPATTLLSIYSGQLEMGHVQIDQITTRDSLPNVFVTIEGDGVVMAKSVKRGEAFVVRNTTIEECECVNGNRRGIKVEFATDSSKFCTGTYTSQDGVQ
ncbi:uncharacterized protein MONOS_14794 [Monocercomonoides exilis]|uniref:uncharacterized protein n=1 Tax=Monocercomonoides exilis TaxID=2049356 RepID=UPI0035593ABE|nr:hypothetical protein MONOS_14794 [Monocercomonoides exilis]|eukprot:MONOS_14794.1-p1 / transcript=MONOS_14794.1 / gene=MONOS_14794 / organism=Monocercomonoides_exilis_PA203 / gene_product=unspecified product / transcript_product=unspecified product / location=Mono_scaffold01075:2513-3869(-) / protein_length=335 / sequence_SO=supercontig / SO=protein_coding / is_pseudo=false